MKVKDLKELLNSLPEDELENDLTVHKFGKLDVAYDVISVTHYADYIRFWIANREHRKRDVTLPDYARK